jgi:curli production assembly/transport component CsgE
VGALALVVMTFGALAANTPVDLIKDEDSARKSIFDDPLSGIVINRTVTVLGNDFYQYFATAWREKDGDNRFSIAVYERPSARFGSEIWVTFRQDRVFHTFLSPARQAARKVSQQAVEITYKNITDNEVQRMLYQGEDLGKEEL